MHCLEDFQKYFFEIILTEMFSKIPFENFPLYGSYAMFIKDMVFVYIAIYYIVIYL